MTQTRIKPGAVFRCASGVRWVVETGSLLLQSGREGRPMRLDYPQAAVWDLASRGYRYEAMVRLIGAIAAVEPEAAQALVDEALGCWLGNGLLETSVDHG